MDIPEEIYREILSYRSLPSTRKSSRMFDMIEGELVTDRSSNIKRKYPVLSMVVTEDDADVSRFIFHHLDLFDLDRSTLLALCRYVGAKAMRDCVAIILEKYDDTFHTQVAIGAASNGKFSILLQVFKKTTLYPLGYRSVIGHAAEAGYGDLVDWLVKKKPRASYYRVAVLSAASAGHLDIVSDMVGQSIDAGYDVGLVDIAMNGIKHFDIVTYIIARLQGHLSIDTLYQLAIASIDAIANW